MAETTSWGDHRHGSKLKMHANRRVMHQWPVRQAAAVDHRPGRVLLHARNTLSFGRMTTALLALHPD